MEEEPEQKCSSNRESQTEYLERCREQAENAYQSIIRTILERNKAHEQSAQYLRNAVDMTRKITLEFLEQINKHNS